MLEIKTNSKTEGPILMSWDVNVFVNGKRWGQVQEITLKMVAGEPVIAEIVAYGIDGLDIDLQIPKGNIKIHKVIYVSQFWSMVKYRIKKLLKKKG